MPWCLAVDPPRRPPFAGTGDGHRPSDLDLCHAVCVETPPSTPVPDSDIAFSTETANPDPVQPVVDTKRRLWIVAGATAGTILLGLAWLLLYAAPEARNAIQVEPRWLRCGGESIPYEIANADDNSSDPRPEFAIRLKGKKYDRCQMEFTIINTGDRKVHIDKLEFPGLAPGDAGGPLEADRNGGEFAPRDPAADDSSSAFIDVDSDLEGNSSFDELVDLRVRTSALPRMGSGVISWTFGQPRVHLSYLGIPQKAAGGIAISVTE